METLAKQKEAMPEETEATVDMAVEVAEEKVEDTTPETAPEVEQAPVENVNGDAELAELKDIMGRSGVMGMKF